MDVYNNPNGDIASHSLSGYVFHKIREDILNGKYKENEELKEVSIGKELGVSRTPVREALRQLELEGLVQIIPNKGAYVVGITLKDVKDIYEMRELLEGLCVKKVCENITKEQISELESIIELSEFYCEKNKPDKVLELDNQYHELLYVIADSKMIKNTLTDFHQYLQRMRKQTLSDMDRARKSNLEHRAVLDAIKQGDCENAMKHAREHILNTMKNIEEHGLW